MVLSLIAESLYFFFVGGFMPTKYCSTFRWCKISYFFNESIKIQIERWQELGIELKKLCQPSAELLVSRISNFNNE